MPVDLLERTISIIGLTKTKTVKSVNQYFLGTFLKNLFPLLKITSYAYVHLKNEFTTWLSFFYFLIDTPFKELLLLNFCSLETTEKYLISSFLRDDNERTVMPVLFGFERESVS